MSFYFQMAMSVVIEVSEWFSNIGRRWTNLIIKKKKNRRVRFSIILINEVKRNGVNLEIRTNGRLVRPVLKNNWKVGATNFLLVRIYLSHKQNSSFLKRNNREISTQEGQSQHLQCSTETKVLPIPCYWLF